jgi:hypothetical protein
MTVSTIEVDPAQSPAAAVDGGVTPTPPAAPAPAAMRRSLKEL